MQKNEQHPYDQRLARILVTPFAKSSLHPNHLTLICLLLGLSAAVMFISVNQSMYGFAALIYMLAVFTDHLDGELARMSGKISNFGDKFDYIVGGLNYTMLFISLGIGLFKIYGDWALILGFCAGLSNPIILILRMKMDTIFGKEAVKHPSITGFEIEDAIYLIGPIIWFSKTIFFFVPYALGTIGYLIWTIWQYFQWQKIKNNQ